MKINNRYLREPISLYVQNDSEQLLVSAGSPSEDPAKKKSIDNNQKMRRYKKLCEKLEMEAL